VADAPTWADMLSRLTIDPHIAFIEFPAESEQAD
jgi:hypothetical protein